MKGIIILGTASDVGKSLLVTAICRLLANENIKVTPFKSQNLSPYTERLPNGEEVSRAQAIQALAANTTPSMYMNPIMLNIGKENHVDVRILNEAFGEMEGFHYREQFYHKAVEAIHHSLETLKKSYTTVVIEGAGSPAEVNLKARDIVNMKVAEIADVPALLVADISKGGAIASIVGTLTLLEEAERKRVKGIIINQFHGEVERFQEGVDFIENYTGIPVLGVIPYKADHQIAEEDQPRGTNDETTIAAIDAWAQHVKPALNWKKFMAIIEGEN